MFVHTDSELDALLQESGINDQDFKEELETLDDELANDEFNMELVQEINTKKLKGNK